MKLAQAPLKQHDYAIKIYNGRIKILIDGSLFLAFTQLDFKGLYAYKDDTNLYGIDFYLMSSDGHSNHVIETYYKTKEAWLNVLGILEKNI